MKVYNKVNCLDLVAVKSKFYRQTSKIPAVYWGPIHCMSPRAEAPWTPQSRHLSLQPLAGSTWACRGELTGLQAH